MSHARLSRVASPNRIIALADNPIQGDNDVHIRVVRGDVDGGGLVNILDQSAIKANLFAPVTNDTARYDLNADGVINVLDQSIVKLSLFNSHESRRRGQAWSDDKKRAPNHSRSQNPRQGAPKHSTWPTFPIGSVAQVLPL